MALELGIRGFFFVAVWGDAGKGLGGRGRKLPLDPREGSHWPNAEANTFPFTPDTTTDSCSEQYS